MRKLTLILLLLADTALSLAVYPNKGFIRKTTSWYQEDNVIYKTLDNPIELKIKDASITENSFSFLSQIHQEGINTLRLVVDLNSLSNEYQDQLREYIDLAAEEYDINILFSVTPEAETTANLRALSSLTLPFPNIVGIEIPQNHMTDRAAKTILSINPEILVILD